ncbi:MAG: ATP-dependent DNA helicase RecQ, partial [Treponema sp.]|nr:ATP-dependent DNA helicase RecQ [Treponema sp.]
MDDDETPAGADFLTETARRLFGLKYLFPYQRLVISNILDAAADTGDAGTDRAAPGCQIVILPTGAGKSLCFQLPAALLPGATLVIYP